MLFGKRKIKKSKLPSDMDKKVSDHVHDTRKKLGSIDYHLDAIKNDKSFKEETMAENKTYYAVVGGKDWKHHANYDTLSKAKSHANKLENESGYIHRVHTVINGKVKHSHEQSDNGWVSYKDHEGSDAKSFGIKEEIEMTDELDEGKTFRADKDGYNSSKSQKLTKALKKFSKNQKARAEQKRTVDDRIDEENLDELDHHGIINYYISKTKGDTNPKRIAGRQLALSKKWGRSVLGNSTDPEARKSIPKIDTVDRSRANEEVEHIDEISKNTLKSYIKKASAEVRNTESEAGKLHREASKHEEKARKAKSSAVATKATHRDLPDSYVTTKHDTDFAKRVSNVTNKKTLLARSETAHTKAKEHGDKASELRKKGDDLLNSHKHIKRHNGVMDARDKILAKEETELAELSQETKTNYFMKATVDRATANQENKDAINKAKKVGKRDPMSGRALLKIARDSKRKDNSNEKNED